MPFQPAMSSSNTPATAAPGCRCRLVPHRPFGSGSPERRASAALPVALAPSATARARTVRRPFGSAARTPVARPPRRDDFLDTGVRHDARAGRLGLRQKHLEGVLLGAKRAAELAKARADAVFAIVRQIAATIAELRDAFAKDIIVAVERLPIH